MSSVEEQETETSLVLSPPVTSSSFCQHQRKQYAILLFNSITVKHHVQMGIHQNERKNKQTVEAGDQESKNSFNHSKMSKLKMDYSPASVPCSAHKLTQVEPSGFSMRGTKTQKPVTLFYIPHI